MERTLEREVEQFLIDYSASVLKINKEYPELEDKGARMRAFEKLRENGIKRIKGLVAEFGRG